MQQLRAAPAWTQRVLLGAVVAYFAIWIGSIVVESSALALVSAILFGLIAVGIGAVLYVEADEIATALSFAGASLVLGGLLELVWIGGVLGPYSLPVASQAASLLVLVGLLAYVYGAWIAD